MRTRTPKKVMTKALAALEASQNRPPTPLYRQSIVDFFDIHDQEHLRAWRVVEKTGSWPQKFLPAGVYFTSLWQVQLTAKMAEAWVSLLLDA